ncbi:sepiapterin reductase [Harpegnathos saltator]|uniref:Sepiapterin reductase n=1 Tax=Harpegnathos saltator TaxID=610380 RepID=E2C801_HARSA|nr:sepiapterin reductase [Harpegnathos saltator]EFN75919.1 Sepiapterin reductase [Harpegnathos saltator]
MSVEALSGKVFLLVTGASRGIGRQIAITFGSLLQEGSHILLLARNLNALQEVARSIPSKVTVDAVSIDLSKSTKVTLEETISCSLNKATPDSFDRVVLIHNVGTFGDASKVANELTDLNIWREYYDLNVFIPIVLNAVVMNMFNRLTNIKKVVINLTSFYATEAGYGCAFYSTSQAAREMFFKVFTLENPDVDILSYSAGVVETDMLYEVSENLVDLNSKKQYKELLATKTALTPEQTVNRLVEILRKHKYKSADHVDYYDKL